jgi:spermidine synthase
MTPSSASASFIAPERLRPFLVVLFVASGCAALIYEIVWFQLLSLIVGSSAISMGVLLAVFMGGMCLGSLAFSGAVSRAFHPLRVYAALEVGIGLFGLIILFGLPSISAFYTSIGGPGTSGVIVRALFCAICLLPPTMLMGATLPAIARWIEGAPSGVCWLGFLYGGNTMGAVLGCLIAGFYLLRVHEMAFATYVAVLINAALAVLAFVLAGRTRYEPAGGTALSTPEERRIPRGSWPVLAAIALSGATALGTEVIWMRLLGLLLGATTYTFSLILGAVLVGLGLGSTAGSWVVRLSGNPRRAFGWCQILLMGGLAWAGYTTEQSLPFWPIAPMLSSSAATHFQLDFARCLWAVVPAALFWGASFPLALAAVAARGRDLGRMVGVVYSANTVGAIIGALGASL